MTSMQRKQKSADGEPRAVSAVLREVESGRIVIADLEIAEGLIRSGRGLLGRSSMNTGAGLVLPSCNSIHTVGMQFRIDVLFLNREGKALKVASDVAPWRVRGPVIGAKWVVETPAGDLFQQGVKVGRHYEVVRS